MPVCIYTMLAKQARPQPLVANPKVRDRLALNCPGPPKRRCNIWHVLAPELLYLAFQIYYAVGLMKVSSGRHSIDPSHVHVL